MELDNDPTRLVHRVERGGGSNYWVLFLILALWVASLALYVPGMP